MLKVIGCELRAKKKINSKEKEWAETMKTIFIKNISRLLILVMMVSTFIGIPQTVFAVTTSDGDNNTVSASPISVTAGDTVTITATGDNQGTENGTEAGDERYIPINWTTDKSEQAGNFADDGNGNYVSDYRATRIGDTITATFQKQIWDGSDWVDATGTGATDTKTTSITVTGFTVPYKGDWELLGEGLGADYNSEMFFGTFANGVATAAYNGSIYVAVDEYSEDADSMKVSVMKYDSSTGWDYLGTPHFSNHAVDDEVLSMDIDSSDGTVYVAYTYMDDYDWGVPPLASEDYIEVMKYTEADGWESLGEPIALANEPSITVYDGVLYMAYADLGKSTSDDSIYQVSVVKYGNGDWENVGSRYLRNVDDGMLYDGDWYCDEAETPSITIDEGIIYVGFKDYNYEYDEDTDSITEPYKASVMQFDLTNTSVGNDWNYVGNRGFSSESNLDEVYWVTVKTDSHGIPYVSFCDYDENWDSAMTVMKYDSSNNDWVLVGDRRFSDMYMTEEVGHNLLMYNDIPYVYYAHDEGDAINTVMKYTGIGAYGGWERLGADRIASNDVNAQAHSFIIESGAIYAVYREADFDDDTIDGLTVKRYIPASEADTDNNTAAADPSSVSVNADVNLIAAGDRQDVESGTVYGEERYLPESWSSTETSMSGTFTNENDGYKSTYTPAAAGTYTVTITFRKQIWDGFDWLDTTESDSTKTVQVTVGAGGSSGDNHSGHSSGSTTAPTPGVDILVNGKAESAGTATQGTLGNQTVTNVTVDEQKLEQKLESEGTNAIITIPINTKTDIVIGELNGQMVSDMEAKQDILELRTPDASYFLPAQQIDMEAISAQVGQDVALKDIKIQVTIAKSSTDTVKVVEDSANKGNFTIMIPPMDFTVKAVYGGKTVDVSKFDVYVKRLVAIPEGVDPSKITTGVITEPDGSSRHVPTEVVVVDGKYYVQINSLTNSTYSVVWHPLEFADVANHWSKAVVNDMGSRMVVSGVGNGLYEPDRDITRAEFAAIVVRGLGLKSGEGSNSFADVPSNQWYSDYIKTATTYKIINGYGDGNFGPDDKITREQAMTMIARAMNITGLKANLASGDVEKLLAGFTDGNGASDYAKETIAACVKTGVVSGRDNSLVAPKDNITRAEVAAIVSRLLKKSDLI